LKICLVFPTFHYKKFIEKSKIEEEEFGVYPPLNLACVASIIEKTNHSVKLIDCQALNLSKQQTLQKIKAYNPDIIGFMLTTYMFSEMLEWIKYTKQNTNTPIMVGGINMLFYPKETMSHKEIDFGFIGPVIYSLPEFLDCLEKNKDYSKIKGLCFRKNNKLIINKNKEIPDDIEKTPFPARHLLPNEKYFSFVSRRKNFTLMLTSRHCPFQCIFCEEGNTKYFGRTPNHVVNEIEECINRYNIKEIDFFDREFTIDKKRVINICNEILKRNLKFEWTCRSRVDSINEEMLALMKKSGCRLIFYGLESGSDPILKNLKKGITVEKIKQTIMLTKKHNIEAFGFFMFGNPGETIQDIRKSIKLAKELDLDYVQFTRTIAKPFSPLHKELIRFQGYDYWQEYILGKRKDEQLPMPWSDFTIQELENMIAKAYKDFYFRPKYIVKRLLRTRSPGEILRYARAGLKMVCC